MPLALVVHENKKLVVEELPVSNSVLQIEISVDEFILQVPEYGPKDLLIKVTHAAQNPTDWKHVHYGLATSGSIVGCDFAGEVVEVGKEAIGSFNGISCYVLERMLFFR